MSKKAAGDIVNNIDLKVVSETKRSFEEEHGHHNVEKIIEGEYRMDGSPSFVGELRSDVSCFVVSSDEPRILGGRGAHASPLSYVLYGILACFANTIAIQAGLKGVKLRKMQLTGRLSYDIGPVLTGIDSPMIEKLEISVDADRDIGNIIQLSEKRCPALYLVSHGIRTEVSQTGRYSRKT